MSMNRETIKNILKEEEHKLLNTKIYITDDMHICVDYSNEDSRVFHEVEFPIEGCKTIEEVKQRLDVAILSIKKSNG